MLIKEELVLDLFLANGDTEAFVPFIISRHYHYTCHYMSLRRVCVCVFREGVDTDRPVPYLITVTV